MADFLGANGGQLAIAWATGAAASWAFCVKMFVGPLRSRADKLEAKLERIETEKDARIAKLEERLEKMGSLG